MATLAEIDIPERLAPVLPPWLSRIVVALACVGAAIIIRILLDAIVPGGAVFALIFPAAVVATLFARWEAGAITALILLLYSWYFLWPVTGSFRFATASGPLSVVSVAISAVITIGVAEIFRAAARRATHERDLQIAERDLFLVEFDHRVKNNFTVVASLLDMQRRRAEDPATVEALGTALSRVESIARAHRHLYRGDSGPVSVDMAAYLKELCDALAEALMLRGAINLDCHSDAVQMPRDRAVSIGLVINELVTNAAKHAFSGRSTGRIQVSFQSEPGGWRLIVADNGIGLPPGPVPDRVEGGLGQKLIDAFVRQARGTIATKSDSDGTQVIVHLSQ